MSKRSEQLVTYRFCGIGVLTTQWLSDFLQFFKEHQINIFMLQLQPVYRAMDSGLSQIEFSFQLSVAELANLQFQQIERALKSCGWSFYSLEPVAL